MFGFNKYYANIVPFIERTTSGTMSDYFYKDYIKPITKEEIDAFSKALDEFYDKWMKRTFENGKNDS